MADSGNGLHEPLEKLSAHTLNLHRAIQSLMEELEAVDWYQQRADAADNEALREILEHNRDEEKEHAAMLIEWLRRNDAGFASFLQRFLYSEGPITHGEDKPEELSGAPADDGGADDSLGIRGLTKGE